MVKAGSSSSTSLERRDYWSDSGLVYGEFWASIEPAATSFVGISSTCQIPLVRLSRAQWMTFGADDSRPTPRLIHVTWRLALAQHWLCRVETLLIIPQPPRE